MAFVSRWAWQALRRALTGQALTICGRGGAQGANHEGRHEPRLGHGTLNLLDKILKLFTLSIERIVNPRTGENNSSS